MIQLPIGKGYFGNEPHLSPNSATMFMRCAEQWRRRYILGEREIPNAKLIRGFADHAAHEVNFRQKIETKLDLPLGDVLDAFATSWDERIDTMGGEGEIQGDEDGKSLGEIKDLGFKTVEVYHKSISPSVAPTDVEVRATIELGGVMVECVADVLTEQTGIERKTTGRKQNTPKPDHKLQAGTYATIYMRPFALHYVADSGTITTPVTNPELLVPVTPSVAIAYNRVALAIVDFYARFGPDEAWPGTGLAHPWACGFCGWRDVCVYQGGRG